MKEALIGCSSVSPCCLVNHGAANLDPADSATNSYPVSVNGEEVAAPFVHRESMAAGVTLAGPSVILEATGTTVIEPGWQAEVNDLGDLVLRRVVPRPQRPAIGTSVDPVQLEIFNNLFMNIAEQMGVVLENTAASVNIKERLDLSCAVFDPGGELIANAPRTPVHLGSMSASIKSIIRQNPNMFPVRCS